MSDEDPTPRHPRGHRPPQWMHREGGRPPWWPGNEPWPPRGPEAWRRSRRRIARRFGCFLLLVLVLLGAIGSAFVWLVLALLGVVGSAPFARSASGAALLLGIVAVILAVRIFRRVTVPGQQLVEAAQRIETGDYSARVPVRGPRELRAVARAINSMSARLEADEVQRRSVLADVAHELRTPLTIIRGQAEGIADGVYPADPAQMQPILAATRTLEKLVEDLRTSALADAGALQLAREPVDVAELVHETLETFRPTASAAGIALVDDVGGEVSTVSGDPVRLSSVLANLVSNAVRHTRAGGTVRVAARRSSEGVEITVSDDGEGIPPDLLPRVFDRFVRGAASGGSGLGLAIVRDVVEAHGGTVTVESRVGVGTTVRVRLPGGTAPGDPVTR
ncbi:MAG TPA: HAMP domain-containing sensor histidine kinase [Candidatus Dormibacteraeota bacterium]|nr:HAMP domain-containing sensor histidine kinase [Candidatus Dormibacteraeota bacterium]